MFDPRRALFAIGHDLQEKKASLPPRRTHRAPTRTQASAIRFPSKKILF
jgi:hypothetical protein